jgi:hypothetical protein
MEEAELWRQARSQVQLGERGNNRVGAPADVDQEFQNKQKELVDKLAKEQKTGNRPYLIAKGTIDQLLKDRSALIAEKKPSRHLPLRLLPLAPNELLQLPRPDAGKRSEDSPLYPYT